MILKFKQRFMSWFDSYDIYNEQDEVIYQIKGRFSIGHCLEVYDQKGVHVATLKEKIWVMLPTFEVYIHEKLVGFIRKKFRLLKNDYDIQFKNWTVDGSVFGFDYTILDANHQPVAKVEKELFHFTDTYLIRVHRDEDALTCLMFVLAIDAEKCSSK